MFVWFLCVLAYGAARAVSALAWPCGRVERGALAAIGVALCVVALTSRTP